MIVICKTTTLAHLVKMKNLIITRGISIKNNLLHAYQHILRPALPVQAILMGLSKYCCLKTRPAAWALASGVPLLFFAFSCTDGGIKYRFLVRTGSRSGTG